MKIVGVTGANGYIGKALVKAGAVPISVDVREPKQIREELEKKKPDVVLHLAAKSDPDWCEDRNHDRELIDVNLRGTYNVMHNSNTLNIPCVLMSSGQIWRGGFWERLHGEDDPNTIPVNQYGASKLASEAVVRELFFDFGCKIVRSSYVFDSKRLEPKLSKLKKGEVLYEPTFIKRSFIHLSDIVRLLMEYCERLEEMPKILHLAGSETVSWYDFTQELACQYLLDKHLVKPRRKEDKGFAPRPANAGLNVSLAKSLGFKIPDYIEGIKKMRNELS